MNRRIVLQSLVAAGLALTGSGACAQADAPGAVHVMRHLDTPAGVRDPDLTDVGKRRAVALVAWFAGKPLTAIYVTNPKRTRQSVAPLAAARGLVPKVYDPADPAALVATTRAAERAALIVGHSNTVPEIIERLGGARPAPLSHPDFGDVWTVTAAGTAHARVAAE